MSSGLCSRAAPPHFASLPVLIPTGGPERPLRRTKSVLEENKAGQSFLKAACLPAADATWGRTALPTSLGASLGKCACSKCFQGLTHPAAAFPPPTTEDCLSWSYSCSITPKQGAKQTPASFSWMGTQPAPQGQRELGVLCERSRGRCAWCCPAAQCRRLGP